MNPLEQARALPPDSIRDVAQQLGRSPQWVSQRRKLLAMPRGVQMKIADHRLPLYIVDEVYQYPINQQVRIAARAERRIKDRRKRNEAKRIR